MATLKAMAGATSPAAAVALKIGRLLGELETYVCGQSDIIIDYATARRREEPISTTVTESTVQWLLKVRCAMMNGTLEHDHAVAERRACRPFRRAT